MQINSVYLEIDCVIILTVRWYDDTVRSSEWFTCNRHDVLWLPCVRIGGNVLSPVLLPSIDKGKYGFSGLKQMLAALSSLPGDSPAASSALPAAQSAPEKLRGTCQREKIGAGKKADAGGLTPAKDNDAASVDFGRWQACCHLSTEGRER